MATFHQPIIPQSTIGSTNFKVRYRLMGESAWISYLIPVPSSSGTTATISGLLNNRIYDVQVQNINGSTNDLSTINQGCGLIFETDPTFSPTSTSVGYSFGNLSVDIDSYTIQLTTYADPGTVIASTVIATSGFPSTISGNFTGLTPLTTYRILITPVVNQFSETFVYIFATEATGACADVSDVVATITA